MLCNWATSQTSVNYDFLIASSSRKFSFLSEFNLNTKGDHRELSCVYILN